MTSRRDFLATALVARGLAPAVFRRWAESPPDSIRVSSPNGAIDLQLHHGIEHHLTYAVSFQNRPMIEPSPLGILLDGVDLGQGVEAGKGGSYRANEGYARRGGDSQATNRVNGARGGLRPAARRPDY